MDQEPMGGSPPESPAPATPPPAAPVAWETPKAATPVPGAAGFVYGDLPNRIIALVIDIIVFVVFLIAVGIVLGIVGLSAGFTAGGKFDAVATLLYSVISLVVSAAYFIGSWTRSRSTIGMRVLGMQVGNAFDGKTITMEQGVRRWLALWGPGTLASVLSGVSAISGILSLISLVYGIYLLYSTAKSPTKQGFHDAFANTVVVKAARVA